ncbi:hypothetical protein [Ekhidna sp.]
MDLSNHKSVGTTINGITAPIIGIGSAILVYISFRLQVLANRIQLNALLEQRQIERKDKKRSLLYSLLDRLRMDLVRFDELCMTTRPKKSNSNWYLFKERFIKNGNFVSKTDIAIFNSIIYLNTEILELIQRLDLVVKELHEKEMNYHSEEYLVSNKVINLYKMFLDSRYNLILSQGLPITPKKQISEAFKSITYQEKAIKKLNSRVKKIVVDEMKKSPESIQIITPDTP